MGNATPDKGSDKEIGSDEAQEQAERDHAWRIRAIDQLGRALQRMRGEEEQWEEVKRRLNQPPAPEE